MNSVSPSFLAILLFSGLGFVAGRSIFPKINPEKQNEKWRSGLQQSFEQQSGQGGAFVASLRETLEKLENGAEVAMTWNGIMEAKDGANLRAAKLDLVGAASNGNSTAADFVKVHLAESPWNFLRVPQEPQDTKEAVPSPGVAGVGALRSAYNQATDGGPKIKAAGDLAAGLADCDPFAATVWIGSLVDPAERAAALGGLAGAWAAAEPLRAAEWLSSLPEGADRDAAAAGYVSKGSSAHPLLALSWALQIRSQSLRRSVMETVLDEAGKQASDTARHRIEWAELDQREKQEYLESLASHAAGGSAAP